MKQIQENLMTTAYTIKVLLKGRDHMATSDLMEALDSIVNESEVRDLAKTLSDKAPELEDVLYKIIYKNTIEEKESLQRWNDLAFDRA
jgi:hypothetical protein